ncbi:MAG: hypothetical protein JWM64_2335 [Frankiales bacterium]|nr:hypothetical protein [Frankiales bacterium]
MARSHVKELARQAFELDEVVVDDDGDLPFRCGTARYYASVVRGGRVLRVWTRAVGGLRITKPVLREMDAANAELLFSRVYSRHDAAWVEGCLPLEPLGPGELATLCHEVGTTADRLGTLLAAVHGGHVTFPHAADPDHECED